MWYGFAFIVGTVAAGAGASAAVPALAMYALAGGLAAAAFVAGRNGAANRARAALIGAALVAGVARFAHEAETVRAGRLGAGLDGATLIVSGRIASAPACREDACRFLLAATQARSGAALPSRIRVVWPRRIAPARIPAAGERWRLALTLKGPRARVNPGGFDYERWLFVRRIGARGYVAAHPGNGRLAAAAAPTPAVLRDRLLGAVDRAYGDRAAGRLVAALGLGADDALGESERALLEATGTSHLFAISGLHVGLITALFASVGRYAFALAGGWRYRPAQLVGLGIGLAASAGYAVLSGLGVPARRAWLMAAIGTYAFTRQRALTAPAPLVAALALLLAADPLAICDTALWLSASAVALIAAITAGRLRAPSFATLSVATSLGMLPVTALVFGAVPLVSPLVNLAAIPLVSFVVVPLVVVLTLMAPAIAWAPVAALAGGLAAALDGIWAYALAALTAAAGLPHAQPSAAHLGATALAGTLLASVIWVWPVPRLPAGVLAMACLVAAAGARPERPAFGAVEAVVIDVGQGLAVLVRTRHRAYLYDTGPRALDYVAAETTVLPVLAHYGVDALDAVIVSHRDSDHAGGIEAVARAVPVRRWVASPPLAADTAMHPCAAGAGWRADGVRFVFLSPPLTTRAERNDASCVLAVTGAAGSRLLLTGDIEARAEAALLGSGQTLAADVVTVPHHGSTTSSTPAFVAALGARYAVNASGHRNRWALPDPEIVARYHDEGAVFLDTAIAGAICIALDAAVSVAPCERRRPPWRRRAEP